MKKHLFLSAVALFFCGLFLSAQTYHWPLTENLTDVVGAKNGTNFGVTFKNDALRGPVAHFNGDSYARLPQFIKGLSEITIGVWYKMDEVRVWSRIYCFGTGDQTEPKDVLMVIPVGGNSNMYRFTLTNNTGGDWYDIDFPKTTISVEAGKWYYSAVVLKPDSIIIYHNNQKVFAEKGFARPFGTINDVENALGKSFWPDALFKGDLSDLQVYNKALTEAQVKSLYSKTLKTGISKDNAKDNLPVIFAKDNRINVVLKNSRQDEVVSVYNLTGMLLAKKTLEEIQSVHFNTGIYLVKVSGSDVNHVVKVLIK